MNKNYEAVKEILEDQIRAIVKKGDISQQELDNLYKASAIVLDFETKEAMKKAEEQGMMHGGEQTRRGSYGNSNHYPWYMYNHSGNSYENGTGRTRGRNHGSYEESYEGAYDGAYDGTYDGAEENGGSYRRGRNQRTGRYMSRDGRGYSREMDKERMIGKLEDMMEDATSEKERRALEQCVERLERQ